MEKELADIVDDLSLRDAAPDDTALTEWNDAFCRLTARVANELCEFHGLGDTVSDGADRDAWCMELSGFLREYGCPYRRVADDLPMSERLAAADSRQLLLHFLLTELQAARLLLATKPSTFRAKAAPPPESDVASHLKLAVVSLQLGQPPSGIAAAQFFPRLLQRLRERLAECPDGHLGRALLSRPLQRQQDWARVAAMGACLAEEYGVRRRLLLDRIDTTVGSFLWSDRVRKLRERIDAAYQPLREQMDVVRPVTLSRLLASRDSLLLLQKIDSGEARSRSSVQQIRMGDVPDRGGRAWELEPPPPEMPAFRQRDQHHSAAAARGRGHDRPASAPHHHQQQWQQHPMWQPTQQQGFVFAGGMQPSQYEFQPSWNCKMPAWRDAGINYIRYSSLCASVLRRCLKPGLQKEALKREGSVVQSYMWKDGKPIAARKA